MSIIRPADETRPFEDVRTNWQAVTVRSGFTFVDSISSGSSVDSTIEPNAPRHIQQRTFDRYVQGAMKLARVKKMEDDSCYFSEIPGFPGVWGSGETMKDALNTLDEVLREWVLLKIKDSDKDIPIIEEINLNNI